MEAGHWRSSAKVVRDAADEIERLRAERDEARQEVCRMATAHHGDPQAIACERGWSCFKENT
jgi:hypothetical protein